MNGLDLENLMLSSDSATLIICVLSKHLTENKALPTSYLRQFVVFDSGIFIQVSAYSLKCVSTADIPRDTDYRIRYGSLVLSLLFLVIQPYSIFI